MTEMPIKKGDKIKVEYEGTFDDGTVFDSSRYHNEPLEFEVGCGQIIPGFEEAVVGMSPGDEKEFDLKPQDAYGEYDPELMHKISKDQLPMNVAPGMILVATLPNGIQTPVKVVEVTDEWVTIDLNHPLAGKHLNFKVKILDVAS
jgi:FKBP-type peptidyl-prolyl cis-trans isomerase 2